MNIVEFKDRPGSPLYHLEHYIEGDYIKYNSNSGFVDECLRNTPQVSVNIILEYLDATWKTLHYFFRQWIWSST